MNDIAEEIDARGLICPLPVLRLRKRLAARAPGEVVRMLADDPVAVIDVPHYCREAGHVLLSTGDGQDATGLWQVYEIRKG
jgi:tRNA 2-thiouridine synthesizing protein A